MVRAARRLIAGPTFSVVGTVGLINVIRLLSSAVLTRLLTTEDYGVVGIITSITYIVVMLSDVGIFPFLVRHERGPDDVRFLDEVWTLRLLRSVVITAALMALAIPYAAYSGKPALAAPIAVWALTLLLDGFSSLAFAQAVRQGLVARLSWMDFAVNLFQVIATIAIAVFVRSYWAIVIAALVGGVVKVILSYALFPQARRRFIFSRERAGELWRFSRFIAGSSFVTLLLGQTDKVVLSRLLPLSTFGLYSIATVLVLSPRAIVYPYCNRILLPAYAAAFRADGLAGLARVYYAKRRRVALPYMLAMGGLIGAAPFVVALLYDPRYLGVAPLLRILAIAALLLLNNVAAEQALIAAGRVRASFEINLTRLVWLIAGGAAGLVAMGPIGLIWAVGTMEIAAALYSWVMLARLKVLRPLEEAAGLAVGTGGALAGLAIGNALVATGWF